MLAADSVSASLGLGGCRKQNDSGQQGAEHQGDPPSHHAQMTWAAAGSVPGLEGQAGRGLKSRREPLVSDPSRKGREGGQGWIGCLARRLLGLPRGGA